MSKKQILILIWLSVLNYNSVKSLDCQLDNFKEERSTLLSKQCPSEESFNFLKYSSEPPYPGDSLYYMKAAGNVDNCLISENLDINEGADLIFHIFTHNTNNGPSPRCFVEIRNSEDNSMVLRNLILVDSSEMWRDVTFNIEYNVKANIRLNCPILNEKQYILFHSIRLKDKDFEDCLIPRVTIPESTSEITTTTDIFTTLKPDHYKISDEDHELANYLVLGLSILLGIGLIAVTIFFIVRGNPTATV